MGAARASRGALTGPGRRRRQPVGQAAAGVVEDGPPPARLLL